MTESIKIIRSLSFWAYIFLYGGIFGYATFGTANKAIFLWILMAAAGSTCIAMKNKKILDTHFRANVNMADILISIVLLVVLFAIPSWLGLLKSLILLILMFCYIIWYFAVLWKGKLWV